MPKFAKGTLIGIDLGTSYSSVGVWQNNSVKIIENDHGSRTTPSYVAYDGYDRLIGDSAKNQAAVNPRNTVFGVKRLIGKRFSDWSIQSDKKNFPFKITKMYGNQPCVQVSYKGRKRQLCPEEICAIMLIKMREVAESYLGKEVTSVVIAVPAYFNDSQRMATLDAADIAGLNVAQIINEPTAAAIAYSFHRKFSPWTSRNVLIFDLGGGTFDVSLINLKHKRFEVKATAGDTNLGGVDFDNRLVKHFIKEFKRKHGKSIARSPRSISRLRIACERAKQSLSSEHNATVEVDSLFEDIDFYSSISRGKFEELCIDLFKKTIDQLERMLFDSKIRKECVDDIVLVGGSTRIPKVQQLLREFFDGKELCKSINPESAVTYGAAVQAANLACETSHKTRNLQLLELTSQSLGIEAVHGKMIVLIERNTPLPAMKQYVFSTNRDNQSRGSVKLFEGEHTRARNNKLLRNIHIAGIPLAPRGALKIVVTFKIDINGRLEVSARTKITTTNNLGNFIKKDIENVIEDPEKLMGLS